MTTLAPEVCLCTVWHIIIGAAVSLCALLAGPVSSNITITPAALTLYL